MATFEIEIESGQRFGFGENWKNFLKNLDEARILEAEKSLQQMLGIDRLAGMSFLDVGCGSGLFSLAARNLGARVTSFDFDPQSVGCANFLKAKYYPQSDQWTILSGSALDKDFVGNLGSFDVVYSWGVLHHTGQMWLGLENVVAPVKNNGGHLFIALYNDQGLKSKLWWWVKKVYCSGLVGKILMQIVFFPYFFVRAFAKSIITGQNQWAEYKKSRGMSMLHDWYDWLGGFPFEVASVEAIQKFYENKGFTLSKLVTTKSWGNNQFVFTKN